MTGVTSTTFRRVACLQFELQLVVPLDWFVFIRLHRTNLDREELLEFYKVALKRGALLTGTYQYVWALALLIEGRSTEHTDNIDFDDERLPAGRLSRSLTAICRHNKSFKPNTGRYISMEDILPRRPNSIAPGKLLVVIIYNPKSRGQLPSQCTVRAVMGFDMSWSPKWSSEQPRAVLGFLISGRSMCGLLKSD